MNEKAGRAESMSTIKDVGWGGEGREWENILHKLDMTGHKDFF